MGDMQILGMDLNVFVGKAAYLVVAVIVAMVLQRIFVRMAKRALEAANVPSATIFVNLIRVAIWSLALLAVLEPVFGIQPTAFIAALGVTGVVISLGLQDTVSNVIGALGLMISRVITPGDYVTVSGVTGRVVDIHWRHTIVRTSLGDEVVIPNSVLNKTSLVRLKEQNARFAGMEVTVRSDADLEAVAKDIVKTLTASLGDIVHPERGVGVQYAGSNGFGVVATVGINLAPGASALDAKDKAMRALSGKEWLVLG